LVNECNHENSFLKTATGEHYARLLVKTFLFGLGRNNNVDYATSTLFGELNNACC